MTSHRYTVIMVLLLMSHLPAGHAGAQSNQYAREPFSIGAAIGGGAWGANDKPTKPTQRWSVDVTRTDEGWLTGTITLDDSPLMSSGILKGKVEGSSVSGVITDDAGLHVATFTGKVYENGIFRGTYEDRTGEVGTWEWESPLPQ